MYKLTIRNSFYHVLLYYYFKQAYYVYCNSIGSEYGTGKDNYSNKAEQKMLFERILNKIRGKMYAVPSFVSEISIVVNLKYGYPLIVDFLPEEKFWFEYIIHINFNQMQKSFEQYSKTNIVSEKDGLKTLLELFNTAEAIEYLRNKFIKAERIENTPVQQKIGVFGEMTNSHRFR